jgi:hypothetical protein
VDLYGDEWISYFFEYGRFTQCGLLITALLYGR